MKIADELSKHFAPKPSEIVEFHSRNRKEGEDVAIHEFTRCGDKYG